MGKYNNKSNQAYLLEKRRCFKKQTPFAFFDSPRTYRFMVLLEKY
jgi:hypothetical protein